MRETYAQASKVMVLDRWLLDTSTKDINALEVLTRVCCSLWMRRLWTLQEGYLARPGGLLFVFKDAICNLDEVASYVLVNATSMTLPGLVLHSVMQCLILRQFPERFTLDAANPRETQKSLTRAIRTLKFRRTSVASDEPLCLAVLFDQDVRLIATTDPAVRMLKFWSLVPLVPLSLLYWPMPRYSDVKGYRWAPTTLLDTASHYGFSPRNFMRSGPSAQVTKSGLRVTQSGIVFPTEWYHLAHFPLVIKCAQFTACPLDVTNSDLRRSALPLGHHYGELPEAIEPMMGAAHRIGLWGAEGPFMGLIWVQPFEKNETAVRWAVLVTVRQRSASGLQVGYVGGIDVHVQQHADPPSLYLGPQYESHQVPGTACEEGQVWIID